MANLNFALGTPTLTTKLVGFETPVAYGERTYSLGDVLALLEASLGTFKRSASSNSAGDTTLTIEATTRLHTEVITFSGTTRTSIIVIPVAGRTEGDIVKLRLINPVGAAITQEVRNATSSGTILYSIFSDDGSAVIELYFDGTAFQPFSLYQPVI